MFSGCYLDKYALILLIVLIGIFFIQKYNQKKKLKELKNIYDGLGNLHDNPEVK